MANPKTFPIELVQKLDEINSWLFYGDKGRVARKSKKSADYVGKVLKMERFNSTIIECAIEVMNENKARFEITPKMKVAS